MSVRSYWNPKASTKLFVDVDLVHFQPSNVVHELMSLKTAFNQKFSCFPRRREQPAHGDGIRHSWLEFRQVYGERGSCMRAERQVTWHWLIVSLEIDQRHQRSKTFNDFMSAGYVSQTYSKTGGNGTPKSWVRFSRMLLGLVLGCG